MDVWEDAGLNTKMDVTNGPDLILFRSGGFLPDDLLTVPIGVLENNELSGTLPLRCERVDGNVIFRYPVSGCRRLTAALPSIRMREEALVGVLSAISSGMLEGIGYLIRETEYLLDPDWVWIQGDVRNVKLMVVPIRSFGSPERSWNQWNSLYQTLVRYGLPEQWRQRLNPSNWEKETFRHQLWIEEFRREITFSPPKASDDIEDAEPPKEEFPPFPLPNPSPLERMDTDGDGDTMQFRVPNVSKQDLVRFGAAVACWIGFAWQPSFYLFILACLGTIPLGMTLSRRYNRSDEKIADSNLFEESSETEAVNWERNFPLESAVTVTEGDRPISERTVFLESAEPTVLLSQVNELNNLAIELVYDEADRRETVPIGDVPVRVGRECGKAGIVVDHQAVSRVHLEFRTKVGEVEVSDLGSTNGSFLNDRPLTPHEFYTLREEDTLRIPGVTIRRCTLKI